MAFEDQWTAIFHLRTVSLSEVDRQALTRRHGRWHGQPGLARKLDPDLELIVLSSPVTALVARLTCFFSSIFRGTTKKQLPRPSSHNCRVKTDRSLWAGAPAAYIQMIRELGRSEAEILCAHHIISRPQRHIGKDAGGDWVGLPKGESLRHAAAHCSSATQSVSLGNVHSLRWGRVTTLQTTGWQMDAIFSAADSPRAFSARSSGKCCGEPRAADRPQHS